MEITTIFSSLGSLVSSPHLLGLMVIACGIGILVGATPGIGGRLAIALMIPFVFGWDMISGAVFLLSMHAATGRSGQITSIMFGIPGDGSDAPTVLDGYPLAKQGRAGEALGASLMAGGFGGLIGAIVFAILIPVLEPVVLAFSPAEFFFLAILGITFIAFLAGRDNMFKGLSVGLFGMMLSFVGMDPTTGIARYSGDLLFLWDGMSLVTTVLALFAIPEMIDLGVQGGSIAKATDVKISYRQVFSGVRQMFRDHWWLALRTSVIGSVIGIIPGLGGSAAAWMCYGHAVQSSKHPERFGKGAIEGVIAPETASNAKEGGSLLPTLFFGIPGSSGMAILMGAFLILGIQPGPTLITQHMDLVWMLLWALIVGDIITVGFLIFLVRWVAKVTLVRGGMIIPFVLVIVVVGSYVNEGQWENLVILFGLGLIGYGFLKFDWPRAPFVIGIVLGKIAEESLNKALALWGMDFFLRPLSLILMAMIATTIGYAIFKNRAAHRALEARHAG